MNDRGSSIPLLIGLFLVAGLVLTGGVAASAAFLAQRELQSQCDGAAVAGTAGFSRVTGDSVDALSFDEPVARAAIAQYAIVTWGADAGSVGVQIAVNGDQVVVRCSRLVHIPFETVFAPGGLQRNATSAADAPVSG